MERGTADSRVRMTGALAGALMAFLYGPVGSFAALYEFTLRGTVTGGVPQALNVNLGDECTIRYVLDSTDLDPHPWLGRYAGTHAIVQFPNVTIIGNPGSGGGLTVSLGGPGQAEGVFYRNYGPNYGVNITFGFPDGTITSDSLPLDLPLTQATTSYFDVYPIFQPVLIGTITSYASTEVPEPSSLTLLPLALLCLRIRRHAPLPC